ncbi:MAG: zinc-binding dehydrogenase, partial [Chloroflexi bacterium]|nr:zinc-binding dehydrogenase [Chloroflexota bacterium]
MKAVQIIARGQCAFVEAPKPALQPGSAIVKTLRLSLCGSDIRHIHYLPDDRYPSPIGETGHEMVGLVEAIDPANGSVQPGDIVLCLAPDHGAMQEYYRAPIDRLLPFPTGTPLEQAVQAQQFGTVLFAAKSLPDLRGKTVAVIGQGSAGLWFNFALQQRGAAKIIALDLKAYRLAYSQRFGATDTLHNVDIAVADALRELNGGELPDVVIEAAGEEASIRLAIEIVRENGFILYFGVPRFETMDFPIFKYFWKSLTARSNVSTIKEPNHASTRQALKLISDGAVPVADMITHTFKFADVMEAYELHRIQDEGAVKIVI